MSDSGSSDSEDQSVVAGQGSSSSIGRTNGQSNTAVSSGDSNSDGYDSSSSSNEEDELEDDRVVAASASFQKGKPAKKMDYSYSNKQQFEFSDSDESYSSEVRRDRSKASTSKKGQAKGAKSKGAATAAKPKGGPKTVPFDSVTIAMGDKGTIEKLINWRLDASGKSEEILVKYKNMSYIHNEWVPRAVVEANRNGKMRLQRFLSKQPWEYQYNEDEPFNPMFVKVDRIIDEGESGDSVYYLVKWGQQTYDLCTWEAKELIEKIDPDKIEEFHKRRMFNPSKQASLNTVGKRPSAKEWRVMEESPVYINENQLRSYQLEGLNWLLFCWYNNQNSILADEMGLGKTVQSTVFLDYLYQRLNVKGPFLVVTPLSTLGNWEREIKQWTNLNVVVYHGNDVSRNLVVETEFYYRDAKNQIMPSVYKFDVLLTTYEMAISGMSQLKPVPWRCVVLDEAHKLKNKTSKISEVLKQYKMEHRVLLTGTPLQNSVDELWSLLNFLEPTKFRTSSEKDFLANFNNLTNAADVEKLQLILKPLMLRRLKEDVEKSIPVKEETIIEVELTTMQKKWYRSILEKWADDTGKLPNVFAFRNFSWIKQGASKRTNVPNLMNTMMELRKCCIHPFLLRGAEDEIIKEYGADTAEKQFSALVQASGKMVLIDKLLRKLRDGALTSSKTTYVDSGGVLSGSMAPFAEICVKPVSALLNLTILTFVWVHYDIVALTFFSKVFLLCTRAGGVGINLTVADTVIIFDSDWNPQNDLQAQSRVHRIGQKKPVQIYRLVTRNTYEREMFDRASLKLGLDRAILQRMDAQSAYGTDESNDAKASSLSKTEIEELLKKGAYGAFMDDDASNQFCEEDIDQILQRRTHVIKHDNPAERSSIFSKATFATNEEQVDIDDPNFWDKVAQKAQLNIIEVVDRGSDLIMSEPRQRRQVQRFGNVEQDGEDSEPDAAISSSFLRKTGADAPKLWSLAEKTRLERGLMMYGYAQWDKILELCRNRNVEDLKACSRAIIRHCILCKAVEADIEADVKACLAQDGVDDIEATTYDYPYPGATPKQMYTIRDKINPTPDTAMPFIQGGTPAPWWGPDEDRDLLIGTLQHGYQQYEKIAADPTLCFAAKLGIFPSDNAISEGGLEALENAAEEKANDLTDSPTKIVKEEVKAEPNVAASEPTALDDSTAKDDEMDVEIDEEADGEAGDAMDQNGNSSQNAPMLDNEGVILNQFPTASECGSRIRKIIAAFLRNQAMAIKDEQRRQILEERARAKQEKEDEKVKLKERELTKKDKLEFYRTLVSYGVDYYENAPEVRDWARFKEISQLRKATDVLEDYYQKLLSTSRDILDIDFVPDPDKDYEALTPDKAKKLLKRVSSMKTLRDQVINNPRLETLVTVLRKYGRNGLPEWWTTEHDVAYLHAVAKWGLNRIDLYVEDETLPFQTLYENYLESKGIDQGSQPSRVDEGFWMKEAVAMKRFNSLCDSVVNPVVKRGGGGMKRKKPATAAAAAADEGGAAKRQLSSKSRQHHHPAPELPDVEVEERDLKRKRSDRSEKSKRHKKERESNEDTDTILDAELQPKKKKKHKKKHGHRERVDTGLPIYEALEAPQEQLQQQYPQHISAESYPPQIYADAPEAGAADIPSHKKKKKHKKSSKLEGEQGEHKKKKSKSKKRHHSEGYQSGGDGEEVVFPAADIALNSI
ncbi:choline dehydrogenase 7 [Phlyctochytrium planicorne]|nr:choline dehydrogenase 7 [Phlyctochytrium planicorne]